MGLPTQTHDPRRRWAPGATVQIRDARDGSPVDTGVLVEAGWGKGELSSLPVRVVLCSQHLPTVVYTRRPGGYQVDGGKLVWRLEPLEVTT